MKLYPQGKNKNIIVLDDGKEIFFSYQTPVACTINGQVYITEEFFSQTTSRHINEYTGRRGQPIKRQQEFFDQLVTVNQ